MKFPWILLAAISATLLVETRSEASWLQWLDRQYDSFRRGFTDALILTGSASRRGIPDSKQQPYTRSTDSLSDDERTVQPLGNSLRSTSKRYNSKFQQPVPEERQFPCDTKHGAPGARSPTRPSSVHQLRPGDIDIVGAMGDSLTAANGAAAANTVEVYLENRGLSWSGGGESTWREYLTLPNILKMYNPSLIGYAAKDSLGSQKSSQFNVAEPIAISIDMPFQAKLLVRRMRSDKRVDFDNHWKMLTVMIGGNDFCSQMCYLRDFAVTPDLHRDDLTKALDYLRDNMPRTIVNVVPPPQLRAIQEFKGRSTICFLMNEFECPCLFGLRWQHLKENFTEVMRRFQEVDLEVASSSRYTSKDDFAVVGQPFLAEAQVPNKTLSRGDIVTDFSYLSEDCFHFSQKGQATVANSLWNNMLQPVGNKSRGIVETPLSPFLCPTEEHPYIYTPKNSRT